MCVYEISGGIGEAVLSAVAEEGGITVRKLAVPHIARSAKPAELMDMMGISAACIVKAVKDVLKI